MSNINSYPLICTRGAVIFPLQDLVVEVEGKRVLNGVKNTYIHFIKRNMAFIGMGSMMVTIEHLADGKTEPTILQPIFTFVVLALVLFWIPLAFLKDKVAKIRKYVGYGIFYSLAILGIIGIVLGIRDLIFVFTSGFFI